MLITGYSNYPHQQRLKTLDDESVRAYWQKGIDLPEATYEIEVTDPAWIEHIKEGDAWKTAVIDFIYAI